MQSWKPDKNSSIPMYKQIAEHIKEHIRYGRFVPGEKLSIRKLSSSYNVGAGTMSEAFSLLKEAGLLESLPRSGTRVTMQAAAILAGGHIYWYKLLRDGKQYENIKAVYNASFKATDDVSIKLDSYGLNDDFRPHTPLMQAVNTFRDKENIYFELSRFNRYGLPGLREAVAEHVKQYGINANPANIVIFSGWMEALNIIANSILFQGINFYTMYSDIYPMMGSVPTIGATRHVIPYDNEGIDVNILHTQLKRRQQNNILCVSTANHFPSGVTLSHKRHSELVELIDKYELPVIEADFYRDLWIEEPPPPLKATHIGDRVIYIGTFSHMVHSGMRTAWAILPHMLVERIADVRIQFQGTNNNILELIAEEMLIKNYYNDYISKIRPIIAERIEKVHELLCKYLSDLATWEKNALVYNIWLKFRPEIDTYKLFMECSDYYFSPGNTYTGDNHFIHMNSLSPSLEELDKGLREISKIARRFIK